MANVYARTTWKLEGACKIKIMVLRFLDEEILRWGADELMSFWILFILGFVSSWVDEQTSWWVFEFCLFWGWWVCALVNRRIDKFLSLFLRRLCVLFLGKLCVSALMSSCVFEMVGYWVDEFACWGDYKLMSSWACELTSWRLRELLGYLELAYPRVALSSRYVYKRGVHILWWQHKFRPMKGKLGINKSWERLFETNVLGIDRNQKTHESLPNSQLFRNIANE